MRWNLVIWYAGILLAVIVGFGGLLYVQSYRSMLREVDAELNGLARALLAGLRGGPDRPPLPPGPPGRGGPPGGDAGKARGPRGGGPPPWIDRRGLPRMIESRFLDEGPEAPYFIFWSETKTVLDQSTFLPPFWAESDAQVPWQHEPGGRQREGGPWSRTVQAQREVLLPAPRGGRLLVGRSIEPELLRQERLGSSLLAIGSFTLAIGLLGGWVLSERAIRPIRKISATAQAISAQDLSRRIELTGTSSELEQLACVLNAMFGRLEAAFARQVRFTADASHELRTPLAILQSQAELTLARPRTEAEYREALDTCLRASRRMKELVEALMTLARADAGQLASQRVACDPSALVEETVDLLQQLAQSSGVCLEMAPPSADHAPPLCWADPGALCQVITNLLTNSIQYNRPGGRVTAAVARNGPDLIIRVADDGPGIAAEHLPHLFDRFYRADRSRARAAGQGGAGLGLAICQAIVQAHGGTISVQSEVGSGTTFSIRLPALRPAEARESAPRLPTGAAAAPGLPPPPSVTPSQATTRPGV